MDYFKVWDACIGSVAIKEDAVEERRRRVSKELLEHKEHWNGYYERELANTNKALSNIIGAIEAGIYTETTKQRLENLEDKRRQLEENIAIEKARVKEALSEKDIVQRITSALKLKAKQAVEMLIKRIFFIFMPPNRTKLFK